MPTFTHINPATIHVHHPVSPTAIIKQIEPYPVLVDFDGTGEIDTGELRTLLKRAQFSIHQPRVNQIELTVLFQQCGKIYPYAEVWWLHSAE